VVIGAEPGVILEQLTRVADGAMVVAGARYRDHAVVEKQRTRDETGVHEDEDGSCHAVVSLQTTNYLY